MLISQSQFFWKADFGADGLGRNQGVKRGGTKGSGRNQGGGTKGSNVEYKHWGGTKGSNVEFKYCALRIVF